MKNWCSGYLNVTITLYLKTKFMATMTEIHCDSNQVQQMLKVQRLTK